MWLLYRNQGEKVTVTLASKHRTGRTGRSSSSRNFDKAADNTGNVKLYV